MCPNNRFTRQGLIQNTPLLGIVLNNFLVLGNYSRGTSSPQKMYPNKKYPNESYQNKTCQNDRFTRPGLVQNTPWLGIVVNNFLVLSIKMVTILGVPLPPKKGTPTRCTPMRVTKTKSAPTTGLPDDV